MTERSVTLYGEAGDAANPVRHEQVVEGEFTDEELDEMAWEFAVESVAVESWWE